MTILFPLLRLSSFGAVSAASDKIWAPSSVKVGWARRRHLRAVGKSLPSSMVGNIFKSILSSSDHFPSVPFCTFSLSVTIRRHPLPSTRLLVLLPVCIIHARTHCQNPTDQSPHPFVGEHTCAAYRHCFRVRKVTVLDPMCSRHIHCLAHKNIACSHCTDRNARSPQTCW